MSTASERGLVPLALLLGVVGSFVACCLAGRVLSRRNAFVDFRRFHAAISPEGLFCPTACQVRALGRSQLTGKIAVVVGGNSILRGRGQPVKKLWTDRLQELLGDEYRVLNLAADGAFPAEFGGTAAEILTRDFPRLIFVSDISLHGAVALAPPSASARAAAVPIANFYSYFFWDAYGKGLLPPDPNRAAAIRAWLDEQDHPGLPELVRGACADGLAYSRDLWTTLAYSRFCTVWTHAVAMPFTRPRRDCPDRSGLPRRERIYSPIAVAAQMADLRLAIERGNLLRRLASAGDNCGDNPLLFVPPALRGRTLLLVVRGNPYFVERLNPPERADYRAAFPVFVHQLRKAGYTALAVESRYSASDFVDCCHLNAAGGRKLADEVAPAVRRLAHRLGYDEGERGRDEHANRE